MKVLRDCIPHMEVFDKEKLAQIEPKLIFDANGKERPENVIGVGVEVDANEYSTVDFGAMSESLVEEAKKLKVKQRMFSLIHKS